jgi:hypothetical protein
MIIYQNVPAFYVCALELYKKIFRLSYFADENAETGIGQAILKRFRHILEAALITVQVFDGSRSKSHPHRFSVTTSHVISTDD